MSVVLWHTVAKHKAVLHFAEPGVEWLGSEETAYRNRRKEVIPKCVPMNARLW